MIRKILPLAAAAAALTFSLIPAQASADDGMRLISRYDINFRPYVGARLGAAFTNTDVECHRYDVCHLDDDTVFTVHPYIGINVPYTASGIIGGRFEVEGFFNSKADYRYNSRSGAYIVRDHMDVTSRGFLVNTYVDFYTVDGLVAPYVSVGLGGVWHDADLYSMGRHYSDDRSNVAFQVGGGVNFNFTRNVAVDLNLRYTDMGRVWDKTYVDEIDVDSLDLMAGFRLTF